MPAVLGIDAAWTRRQPSGVALVAGAGSAWRCVAVAPSYASFCAYGESGATVWESGPPRGEAPDAAALLRACRLLLHGGEVPVVAVDMPLSKDAITRRRAADNEVSRAFGRQKCGVHSPNRLRPGPIGERLRDGFAEEGYELAVRGCPRRPRCALLEVYPHPAVLRLLALSERLRYKATKSSRYWPGAGAAERKTNLIRNYRRILRALPLDLSGIPIPLPSPEATTFAGLKRYEDAIDALVCAWVGVKYLLGEAEAYGDDRAAIWVPTPSAGSATESP